MPRLRPIRLFGRLRADREGATIIEFAILMPFFLLLIMGALDLAHTIYARAILIGQVQKAGRDSGLDTNSGESSQGDLDAKVRTAIQQVAGSATVTFTRTAYHNYARAQSKTEPYLDANTNAVCDNGETYEDTNSNGKWDLDAGKSGQGGGKDAVIYTANVQYPRLFPMVTLSGWSNTVNLTATTVLRNQPYENQPDPMIRTC